MSALIQPARQRQEAVQDTDGQEAQHIPRDRQPPIAFGFGFGGGLCRHSFKNNDDDCQHDDACDFKEHRVFDGVGINQTSPRHDLSDGLQRATK